MSPHQVEWLALTRCPFANAVLGSLGVACKVAEVAPPLFFQEAHLHSWHLQELAQLQCSYRGRCRYGSYPWYRNMWGEGRCRYGSSPWYRNVWGETGDAGVGEGKAHLG